MRTVLLTLNPFTNVNKKPRHYSLCIGRVGPDQCGRVFEPYDTLLFRLFKDFRIKEPLGPGFFQNQVQRITGSGYFNNLKRRVGFHERTQKRAGGL
jgi:hypothetical protein